ncbi:HK97 family phage prohead protease [Sphaerisporangium sp. NPDC004334]
MRIKTCPVHIKAAGTHEGTDEGVFEAIVATYDLDSVGDKIIPGAFAGTLADWKAAGNPIPVLWSHMSHDPDYHIGEVLEAEERGEGLWVKARLDLDAPKAAQVYRLLKGRRVTQFSFAYDVEDGAYVEEKDADPYYELRKLKLYEVGPTLVGANQNTDLLDVKAALGKAGRVLSTKNESRLREAAGLIRDVLAELDTTPTDEGKATPPPPAKTEDPARGKVDEPARPGAADDLSALDAFDLERALHSL